MPVESIFEGARLCVVGNVNRDVKIAPTPAGEHLFRDGETPVGFVDETIGGGGANSAFAAASLGARVAFLGKVGADGLGARLERTLQRHGLASHLVHDPVQPSGSSIALAFDNGCRHFLSSLPASRALSFDDLDLTALAGSQHLLRADVWFSEAMLFGGNRSLFEQARQAGLEVSIDLNWDPHWGRAGADEIRARKHAVRDALPWVDLAHGNDRELTEFAETDDLDVALGRLIEWGVKAVVVHLGDRGAGYYQDGRLIVEPPVPAKARVHAAGTGDVLSVCMMLLQRHSELSIPERLRLANTIVSEFIEGSRDFIPQLAD
jgi:sugar/nucleoside kinase (ribokinase family)